MFCPKCNKKVADDAIFCRYCGTKVNLFNRKPEDLANEKRDEKKKKVTIGLILIVMIAYLFTLKCDVGFCIIPSGLNGDYCFIHVCSIDGCEKKKANNQKYCYTHTSAASYPSTSSYPKTEYAESVLKFSNIDVSHNNSYTICTGRITNNGKRTYSFVEIKGLFKNSSGIVLDTDWTYAVGSEGLAPNESTTFQMSVDKNYYISECSIEILDYDRE